MLRNKLIFFFITLATYTKQGSCDISFRSANNYRTLGFKYDAPSTFSPNTCDSTYSKYLMYVTAETDTAFFDMSSCNSDGFCKLQIINEPYKGYCVIQSGDYLISGSCDYAWYFKIDGNKLRFGTNKAIIVGETYKSGRDCDNPYYVKVSESNWDNINVDQRFQNFLIQE